MNVTRFLQRAFRAYFWLLLGGVVIVATWAINRYVVSLGTDDVGLLAIAGFVAVLAVFLYAIRRMAE